MYIVQQEDAFAQAGDEPIVSAAVEAPGSGAFQSIQQTLLVLVSLQFPNEPGSSIREGFVVHVHRILGGQQQTQSKSARLLQHAQEGLFGRRVGLRRQVAENFIHVEQCAQGSGAGLGAHPGLHRREQERDEEHALGIAQVRQIEDTVARPAIRHI